MVYSRIDGAVNYPNTYKLNDEDAGFDASVYKYNLYGVNILIAIGNPKYIASRKLSGNSRSPKNLAYVPLYLINDDQVERQIGIFEYESDKYHMYLDDDTNELSIDKLNPPIIYPNITKDILKKYEYFETVDVSDEEEEEVEEEVVEEEVVEEEKPMVGGTVVEEEFIVQNWVQDYIGDSNVHIIENEGKGESLFASIRDAFRIGVPKTLDLELRQYLKYETVNFREIVSREVTPEIYEHAQNMYNTLDTRIREIDLKINKLRIENSNIKTKVAAQKTTVGVEHLIERNAVIKREYMELLKSREEISGLMTEYAWMRIIHSIDQFRAFILTPEFYATDWAVSILERVMRVKFIVLSRKKYDVAKTIISMNDNSDHGRNQKREALMNVIERGDGAIDPIIFHRGAFEPLAYIMLEHNERNYRLVVFNNVRIVSYTDINSLIREYLRMACLNKRACGVYSLIKEFNVENDAVNFQKPVVAEEKKVVRHNRTVRHRIKERLDRDIAKINNELVEKQGVAIKKRMHRLTQRIKSRHAINGGL